MPRLTRFLGRNGQKAPTEIHDLEAIQIQNLFLSGNSLVLRGGKAKLNSSSFGNDAIWGLHRSYVATNPFWLVSTGTKLKSNASGSFSDLKTWSESNKGVGFLDAKSACYVFSAQTTDKIQKTTNGTTIADHPDADAPFASFGVWYRKRMVVNDLTSTTLSRIWLTDTNDPDTFRSQDSSAVETEGGYIDISTGDGDRIKALTNFGSTMLIFKERSIHMLTGDAFTGDDPFRVIELFRGIGSRSPRSVRSVENGVMFIDTDGILRYFYGPARRLMSGVGRPIEDVTSVAVSAGIPENLLEEAASGYFDRKYFLSFAGSGDTTNTKSYALDMRVLTEMLDQDRELDYASAWTELTGAAWNVMVTSNGPGDTSDPYYGDATTGTVWQFLTGQTDDGSGISFVWKSKAYGADEPDLVKAMSKFNLATRNFTSSLILNVFADLATSAATSTKTITPDSSTYAVNTWVPPEGARGKLLQVGFSGSSSGGFECLSMDWDWGPKRRESPDA